LEENTTVDRTMGSIGRRHVNRPWDVFLWPQYKTFSCFLGPV